MHKCRISHIRIATPFTTSLKDKGFEYTNPDIVDGRPLYQKDIMLTPQQWQALRERKAIADLTYRWPAGPDGFPLVPYVTSIYVLYIIPSVDVAAVKAGLKHWTDNTCIKFKLTTNTNQPHLRFILGNGCWSYIGRIYYWNGQDISIGNGCNGVGTVAHEVGHAMGFYHEQSRPERDSFVRIISANIISGMESNFNKYSAAQINNYSVPYDYTSVMHYGSTYLSKNGKLTISTIDPLAQGLIGQRSGLSHRDKLLANRMYGCIDKWLAACKLSSDPCKNGGYLGVKCGCVCPPGTSGSKCQTITGGYYDNKFPKCSKTITKAGVITSPNYPNNYPAGSRCTYVIKAPKCYYARLTFSSFKLYGRNPYCNNVPCCYFDFLEIRTTNTVSGDVFCATDISAGRVFTASVNPLILYFNTESNFYKGWSATVSFAMIPGCRLFGRKRGSSSVMSSVFFSTVSPTEGEESIEEDGVSQMEESQEN
nr:blastula protease 10-like [Procambarus clarkii]